MSRLRIRSIKPEMFHDEKVAALSRDARLLVVGLVTMADDEGRIRAFPAAIQGHVFPADADAPRRLDGWLAEIERSGIILRYVVDGMPYIAFRNWKRHQRINRATESCLPPPPDPVVAADNAITAPSGNDHGELSEEGVSTHANGRAGSVKTHG